MLLTDLVDDNNVRVLQSSSGPGLAEETFPGLGVTGHGWQHGLDGHQPGQLRIFRLEDDAHAAVSQHGQHPVGPQPAQFIGRLSRRQQRGPLGGLLPGGVPRFDTDGFSARGDIGSMSVGHGPLPRHIHRFRLAWRLRGSRFGTARQRALILSRRRNHDGDLRVGRACFVLRMCLPQQKQGRRD